MQRSFALTVVAFVFALAGCGGTDQNVVPSDGPDAAVGGTSNGTGGVVEGSGGLSNTGGAAPSGGASAAGGLTGSGGVVVGAGGASVGGTSAGGSGGGTSCNYPDWVDGASYVVGDIVYVSDTDTYYIAENDNPGYEPWTSTWYWEPYDCQAGSGGTSSGGTTGSGGTSGSGGGASSGGTTGSGGTSGTGFASIVSEALFNQIFPNRNSFYTYQGLVAATAKYPAFVGTGSLDVKKREAAAFLANVARETGKLIYIEQIAKAPYCSSTAACPCEAGKQYYGRGPIQISWNYNYCTAGDALGYDLRKNPELVAQSSEIAWATGLWFWMTQEGAGYYTPHDGIAGGHGFGETIRSINGGQECGGNWGEAGQQRVQFYEELCDLLGVSYGSGLTC